MHSTQQSTAGRPCRSSQGPQFAKVYVRIVDWAAEEKTTTAGAAPRNHESWRDPFVVVELPLEDTVEALMTVAVCRWGRGVLPATWLFLANSDGKCMDGRDDVSAAVTPQPLEPTRSIATIPRLELPMTFVLMSKPSAFVDRAVVASVIARMQALVHDERERPRLEKMAERSRLVALEKERSAKIALLEESERRRELKAVLSSHQKEEHRLVQLHSSRGPASAVH